MPWQIGCDQPVPPGKRIAQSVKDPKVHAPAVPQHERLALAADFAIQLHAADRRSSAANVSSKASMSEVACAADNVIRRRELPAGTVGGLMAPTQNPAAASASAHASARAASPTINGWMGLCEPVSGMPSEAAPAQKRAMCCESFTRRQPSSRTSFSAALPAAATAGGSAVV